MPETIDVIVITGYLGAGKTTLLNHMLALPGIAQRQPALLINEFGPVGVDGALVHSDADLAKYELNQGSLFCACTRGQFFGILKQIAADGATDLVLIEATGIAETADLEDYLTDETLTGRFAVRANACLVDAAGFIKVLPFLKAAAGQVRAADGIVVNKIDLVTAGELEQLQQVLTDLNARAPITLVRNGAVDETFLTALQHHPIGAHGTSQPPKDVHAVSFKTARTVDRARFETLCREHREHILRLKGNIHFTDGVRFVEMVGGELSEREAEDDLAEGTAFTVIGYKLPQADLQRLFQGVFV